MTISGAMYRKEPVLPVRLYEGGSAMLFIRCLYWQLHRQSSRQPSSLRIHGCAYATTLGMGSTSLHGQNQLACWP